VNEFDRHRAVLRTIPGGPLSRKQQRLVAELRKGVAIPGIRLFAQPALARPAAAAASRSNSSSRPRALTKTSEIRRRDARQARRESGLTDLDTNLKLNKPQIEVKIDRHRVADLGLDVSVIGRTLETLLGGRQVTRFEIERRAI
jgi:multidrug efflux pump